MGKAKDLMMEYEEQEWGFRDVVEDILIESGYSIAYGFDRSNTVEEDHVPYDWKVRDSSGKIMLTDIKTYRSTSVDRGTISNGLKHLGNIARREQADKIGIVTNAAIADVELAGIFDGIPYEIFDSRKLYEMTINENYLDRLDEAIDVFIDETFDLPLIMKPQIPRPPTASRTDFDPVKAIKNLKECPESNGPAYEKACEYAIKGVFANDFNRWSSNQHRVENGFHRLDLLGHINSDKEFWKGLRYDFRSRYVIFEFKNYVERTSQKEIYTTEKYLFAGALRMVAIMVARHDEDDGSKKAREGALREHGKLIMLLTGDELIQIVETFRVGDDVYKHLIDNLHKMLSVIGR